MHFHIFSADVQNKSNSEDLCSRSYFRFKSVILKHAALTIHRYLRIKTPHDNMLTGRFFWKDLSFQARQLDSVDPVLGVTVSLLTVFTVH